MTWEYTDEANGPVISTQWGQVTSWARRLAALNMRDDPAVKARVEQLLIDTYGPEVGMAESKRRYPEAYEEIPS
jgi:hypothetical protein